MALLIVVIIIAWDRCTALSLGKVRGLGLEELGGKVSGGGLRVGITTLPCFAVFELGMCWEKSLMVSGTSEGLFSSCLDDVSYWPCAVDVVKDGSVRDRKLVCER